MRFRGRCGVGWPVVCLLPIALPGFNNAQIRPQVRGYLLASSFAARSARRFSAFSVRATRRAARRASACSRR